MSGWIPTPIQIPRNTYVGSRLMGASELPETLDYRPDLAPIRDQGQQGTCVAQAGATMKEWQERKDIGYRSHLSPQFLYNLRTNYPNEGMYFSDLMKILATRGICQEYLLPYGRDGITKEASADAKNFKIKSYAEIPRGSDINRVKTTLATNGPCVISFPVYNYTSQFWNKRPGESYLVSHAVALVGYTQDSFILRNSWGTSWGDRGYSFYPFEDYLAGKHYEIWTTVDDKSVVVPPPPESKCQCSIL